ncbi:MAG: IS5 family transposase ISMasp6 [Holosporales bacterium]
MDAHGLPVRTTITSGTVANCKQAIHLIEGINAQNLLADKAYNTNQIVDEVKKNINPVILPKKNRKEQRVYDKHIYKYRHLVENAFLHLKRWRGIATRYAKNTSSFLASVQIRCLFLWLNIS